VDDFHIQIFASVGYCELTLFPFHNSVSLRGITFDVTGRLRPKAGANLQAQVAGGPVDGGVGVWFKANYSTVATKDSSTVAFLAAEIRPPRCVCVPRQDQGL